MTTRSTDSITHHPTTHLTEEQFNDAVLGLTPADIDEHLNACVECSAEAIRVRSSIAEFSAAATAWSDAQPSPSTARFRRRALMVQLRPVAGFAAAAALVIGVAIPVGHYQRSAANEIALASNAQVAAPSQAAAGTGRAVLIGASHAQVAPHARSVSHLQAKTVTSVSTYTEAQSAPQPPRDEIAYDNALMSTINAEINEPVYIAGETLDHSGGSLMQ